MAVTGRHNQATQGGMLTRILDECLLLKVVYHKLYR